MRPFALWIVLALLVCPLGLATVLTGQTLSGVTLNATGSGTALVVSGVDVYADLVRVANDSISLQNASYNTTGANFSFSLNLTGASTTQYSWQFPNVSATSFNYVSVLNGLAQDVTNATILVGTGGVTPTTPRLTYPNGTNESPSYAYAQGLVSINASSLPSGTTLLTLNPTVPVASGVTLTPTSLLPPGTLVGEVTPLDADGGLMSLVEYEWYADGVLYSQGSVANVTSGTLLNPSNISGVQSAGQEWLFRARVSDGVWTSPWASSSPVRIENPVGGGGNQGQSVVYGSANGSTNSSGSAQQGGSLIAERDKDWWITVIYISLVVVGLFSVIYFIGRKIFS